MFATEHVMAAVLLGLLLGLGFCAFVWWSSEHAECRMRIERARRRDHSKVPALVTSSQDHGSYIDLVGHG